jgi:acyl-CoA dehydrogenase
MRAMDPLVTILTARPDLEVIPSRAAWWERHRAIAAEADRSPMDQAILGGFACDRLGYAFASGYQAALRALVPELPRDRMASLCVTERGGAHPRSIEARLDAVNEGRYRLSGHKRWATLSGDAGVLLVAASEGVGPDGRSRIRIARVDSAAPGVTRHPTPEAPFVPEVSHDEVELEGVIVEAVDVLPGDGFERYVRPFRTFEDLHVHAAVLAYLAREARVHGLPRPLTERIAGLVAALRSLAAADLGAPVTHVALAGTLDLGRGLIAEIERHWARTESPSHARWERDKLLFDVAEGVRQKRLERAWEALGRR